MSDIPVILEIAQPLLWFMVINVLIDDLRVTLKGIMIALGITPKLLWAHVISQGLAGPLLFYLFLKYSEAIGSGILGIWAAKSTIELLLICFYLYFIFASDWQDLIDTAQKRIHQKK